MASLLKWFPLFGKMQKNRLFIYRSAVFLYKKLRVFCIKKFGWSDFDYAWNISEEKNWKITRRFPPPKKSETFFVSEGKKCFLSEGEWGQTRRRRRRRRTLLLAFFSFLTMTNSDDFVKERGEKSQKTQKKLLLPKISKENLIFVKKKTARFL